jgi:pimeloyl-ACP methyl ester carboxylesterase
MKKLFLFAFFATLFNSAQAQITDTAFIHLENAKLHTVLTKPDNLTNSPLAIIIAGSGPTDMNGNNPMMKNNSLLFLSNALVANNIATVQFDKRGIAKSSYPGFNESDLKVELYAADVTSLITHFKQKGFNNIYLIGHSEGSLIGLISIQNSRIKGFISLCGAGNSADVLLKEQLKPKLPITYFNQVEIIIDSLKNGHLVKNTPMELNALFRPSVQPYLISWFHYNPTELIKNIDCPTLIIHGEKDIQVGLQEAEMLDNASKNSQLEVIKNMNHVLKPILGDLQENLAAYTNPDLLISEELVTILREFIKN